MKHIKKIIALIIIFQFILMTSYQVLDTRSTSWDDSWHLASSLYYKEKIFEGESNILENGQTKERFIRYPHLYHALSSPFWLISKTAVILSNIFYLAILTIFTFLIGKLLHSEKVGLLASILASTYPMTTGLSKFFLTDFPVICLTAPAIYFLLKFIKTKDKPKIFFNLSKKEITYLILAYTIAFLGLFYKQTYAVVIGIPLFTGTILGLKNKLTKSQFITTTTTILITAIVTTLIYIQFNSGLYLINILKGHINGGVFLKTLPKVISYTYLNITGPLLFFIFLYSLTKIKDMKHKTILLLWAFLPIITFAYLNFLSEGRYFAGIIPAIAIITAYGLRKSSKILITVIIIFALIQSANQSLNPSHTNLEIGDLTIYKTHPYIFNGPKQEDWKHDEVLASIKNNSCVSTAIDYMKMNVHNLALKSYTSKKNITFQNICKNPDYFLVPEGNYRFREGKTRYHFKSMNSYIKYNTTKNKTLKLPGELKLHIYKVNK